LCLFIFLKVYINCLHNSAGKQTPRLKQWDQQTSGQLRDRQNFILLYHQTRAHYNIVDHNYLKLFILVKNWQYFYCKLYQCYLLLFSTYQHTWHMNIIIFLWPLRFPTTRYNFSVPFIIFFHNETTVFLTKTCCNKLGLSFTKYF
jgi:hypothetical protein